VMTDSWSMIKKELAVYGINLLDGNLCEYFSDGNLNKLELVEMDKIIREEIKDNTTLLNDLWIDLSKVLNETGDVSDISDPRSNRLFIFSLKDLSSWLNMFDPMEVKQYKPVIENALKRDSLSYSEDQKKKIVEYKISIDWVHRVISRLYYMRRLVKVAYKGKTEANKNKIVVAKGISGPWANLDLPMQERVWNWMEEDENFRNRDRNIRKQRRYRKGLEHYNKPEVGEGHYWREIRNEPYKWSDKGSESPYPSRNTMFWG